MAEFMMKVMTVRSVDDEKCTEEKKKKEKSGGRQIFILLHDSPFNNGTEERILHVGSHG
jgi:hypothetical protein